MAAPASVPAIPPAAHPEAEEARLRQQRGRRLVPRVADRQAAGAAPGPAVAHVRPSETRARSEAPRGPPVAAAGQPQASLQPRALRAVAEVRKGDVVRINIFGLGYVGSVSAACLASEGHDVLGIDIDRTKVESINRGETPVIEPGLSELMTSAVASSPLRASTDTIEDAELSIVCVGTPSNDNGSLGLAYLSRATEQIGDFLGSRSAYHVVCVRSTVLPGTVEAHVIPLLEQRSGKRAGRDFGVCMNPEFLREGSSIRDYHAPPFTIIGELDARSGDVLEALYATLPAPLIRTKLAVAEMVKYAGNAFHALKITFANEIGTLAKRLGVDGTEVMEIFCRDQKLNISPAYLQPGFAFGGSCLPKDLRALLYKAKELDLEPAVLRSILVSNANQIEEAYRLIRKTDKKRIAVLGLSFKPGTDDLRES